MTVIEQLITDNLDIWTSAIKTKSSAGRGSSNKIELYGIKKLRELVLDLAVRGLLVNQSENDQPSPQLVNRIQKIQDKLIKETGLKTKASITIKESEIYIPSPQAWSWIRLGNLARFIDYRGKTPKKTDSGVRLITAKNVRFGYIDIEPQEFISEAEYESWMTRGFPKVGDILFTPEAPLGNVAVVNIEEKFALAQRAICFQLHEPEMAEFLRIFILSPCFQNQLLLNATGMTATGIKAAKLKEIPIAIPPLAEQHRIVAKVDELMALCDQLEQQTESSLTAHQTLVETLLGALTNAPDHDSFQQAWQRIAEHFDTLFTTESSIDQLKQSILQLAVMGKLVPQDPNDEPASELLKRIAAEKAKLIKEGKIKKQKPLPPITDEEKPFELPEGWEWCKFGLLAEFINGDRSKNYPNKSEYVPNGMPWINTGHIEPDGTLSTSDMNFITNEKFDALRSGKIISSDLVYCLRGATFGKTAFVKPYSEGAIASSLMIIRPYINDLGSYFYRYLISPFGRSQIFRFDNGSAQPNLSANSVMLYAFPCPPLAEQARIEKNINKLFSICDQLKAKLSCKRLTLLSITDSITSQPLS